MKHKYHFKKLRPFLLFLAGILGMAVFQAQDTPFSGDDPRLDQPPGYMMYQAPGPPVNHQPAVITDPNGYDNFDIGINNAEQWVTQNPNNPFHFIFGVNTTAWYHSEDGFSWALNNPTPSSSGDPISAYDSLGNGYAQLLGSGNRVWRTTNNGITWGPGVPSVAGGDRNTLAADQTGGPFANFLYSSAWSPGANFARSTNFGANWTTTASGFPNTTPGNMIAVGPNGSTQGGCVYWVCTVGTNPAPTTYNLYRSTNGGLNFTLVNSTVQPGWVGTLIGGRLTINNCRTRPYPFIACDNSFGQFRGRLYLVYATNDPPGNGNKPDVVCRFSTDQGVTFSAPVVVNDNANPQQSDQWFPAIWCDRYTGTLYIKWYDTRNVPSTFGADVYATFSTNGGVSFAPNQKLTTVTWTYPCPTVGGGSYCGDYDGIVGNRFSSIAVWTDMRFCNRQNMAAYFPDFAMKTSTNVINISNTNDSGFVFINIPSVKLFSGIAKFTASVSPPPGTGTIALSFLDRSTPNLKDSLTAFPDSLRLRVRTSGGVTIGTYTITVTGTGRISGQSGPPIHKRTMSLNLGGVGLTNNNNEIPGVFHLYQNYPNPFNPSTNIRFDLPNAGNVKLTVFDIAGREVGTLINNYYQAGKYEIDFNAEELSSGIYFYRIETPEFTSIRKMILVK
jgi:hypothetical protein